MTDFVNNESVFIFPDKYTLDKIRYPRYPRNIIHNLGHLKLIIYRHNEIKLLLKSVPQYLKSFIRISIIFGQLNITQPFELI